MTGKGMIVKESARSYVYTCSRDEELGQRIFEKVMQSYLSKWRN